MPFNNPTQYITKIGNYIFLNSIDSVGEMNELFTENRDFIIFGYKFRYYDAESDSGNLHITLNSPSRGLRNITYRKINNVPPKMDILFLFGSDNEKVYYTSDIIKIWENYIEHKDINLVKFNKNDEINIRWINENNMTWRLAIYYYIL